MGLNIQKILQTAVGGGPRTPPPPCILHPAPGIILTGDFNQLTVVVNSGTHLYRSSPVQQRQQVREEALGWRVDNVRPDPDPEHHCPARTVWFSLVTPEGAVNPLVSAIYTAAVVPHYLVVETQDCWGWQTCRGAGTIFSWGGGAKVLICLVIAKI